MATSAWDKFLLLLWKNWIISKRHYFQTFFEVLIPVVAATLLILVRGLVDAEQFKENFIFRPLDLSSAAFVRLYAFPNVNPTVAIFPQSKVLERVVENAINLLDFPNMLYMSFDNATTMEVELQRNNYIVGVQFPESYRSAGQIPHSAEFALRYPAEMRTFRSVDSAFWNHWQTNRFFPPFDTPGPRNPFRDDAGYPANYYNETFAQFQSAISQAIIMEHASDFEPLPTYLRRYPYPPFYSDPLLLGLENLLPLIIIVAFFYSCINTVKYIAVEKERQLKEAMKIMGLSTWLHWTAWFVKSLILLLVSISLITVLLCVSITSNTELAVFTYASWTVVWVYLLVYMIATITFCFMMSTFFSKANTASGIAGLMWFVFVMPYNIAFSNYDTLSLGAKLALCLFHNSGMSFGFMLMMRHEGTTAGVQWSNLFSPVTVDDDLSVGATMMMLLADSVIYLLIALYVEKVLPGEFGVAQPWYFPFTVRYWTNRVDVISDGFDGVMENPDSREPDPLGKHAGVRIVGLRKEFGKNKVAVKRLHLNMFDDQITVLLGHNGAGKTTTMSMLTGVLTPSSGAAYINDFDIRTNIDSARQSLGLCPQHNVLFDEMTVAEHIKFFARLKGISSKDVDDEIEHYVKVLQLEDKINSQSHTLSGGMKRKLAVGVALCGGSKVVLCDEPTSGMDPAARRALWDLLIQEKKGRTILLSTHFMDEADILGDRIAIMADGELKAVGSSFFLKKRFGVGYRLICVKRDDCNSNNVTQLLNQYIPNITVDTEVGSELSYVLDDNFINIFPTLLQDLENNSEPLKIDSYGISLTTLEEVFLKVGSDSNSSEPINLEDDNLQQYHESNGSKVAINMAEHDKLLSGYNLKLNQIHAMFLKKVIVTYRSWISMLVQIFIPIFFVVMTIVIVRSFPDNVRLPSLLISFDDYVRTTTVLENDSIDAALINAYQKLFIGNHRTERRLLTITEDMNSFILRQTLANSPLVNSEFLAGATIANDNITIWFNAQGFHTAPLAISTFYNALIRTVCDDCSIRVTNKPLPFRPETRFTQLQAGNNMGFQLAFNTGFAMAFVAALYVMFYIKERVTRAKLLQFVSGVNVFFFWLVSFLWDYMTYIITVLFYIATLAAFQEDGWSTFEQLGRVFLVLMVFGFAFLPLTYLLSFRFDVPASGFVKLMLLNIFTGIIFFMAVFLLLFDGFDLVDVARGLEWGFMIFPLFALSHALSSINIASTTLQICDSQCQLIPQCTEELLCKLFPNCCDVQIFSFEPTGINRNLLFMTALGVGCFILLMVIEYRLFGSINMRKNEAPQLSLNIDSDVLAEKERVSRMTEAEIGATNLVLRDLTKFYKSFLAVNQLSVSVEHSQCFGLLGVNGAGKTSTFKMMTGDENISGGDAWVNGYNLKTDMTTVHRQIGYCPQFDALLDDITGRETLKIFALLRGVPRSEIASVSLKLAESLNFLKHIDKRTKQYSGGNKRKLSTALALMGNPSVVYLDEPTTGMDPGAKRQLWDVICKERGAGKSIILTSHSMEECEALCTRLAIMVNGEFKCLGSTQHLKNKFSNGFHLTIKLKRKLFETDAVKVDQIKAFIEERFPNSELKEEYLESLTYQIPSHGIRWSAMFGIMEQAKRTLEIEDYVLGQTTLEQVFLGFTKYQRLNEKE
ncbi:phospholipid-transporting ATPase ABCA3-like [Uranotaenia lowii]|uniref:phospholipid-transporting ATPase ABCA3-like n=1 Tax=Uranotaenia lowii TaxID=190385 RepID=UPI002478AAC7|nr:phospholipid-transporting ATPase ABCA3-like [Uranotaenia lowii]